MKMAKFISEPEKAVSPYSSRVQSACCDNRRLEVQPLLWAPMLITPEIIWCLLHKDFDFSIQLGIDTDLVCYLPFQEGIIGITVYIHKIKFNLNIPHYNRYYGLNIHETATIISIYLNIHKGFSLEFMNKLNESRNCNIGA